MGKLTDDILKWTLDIDGNPARKELTEVSNATNKLERDNRALATEMAKLEAHGKKGGEEWKKYDAQIKANNVTIAANQKKMEGLRKEVGLNNLSARELRKEMSSLKRQFDGMDPGIPKYKELRGQWEAMNSRLNQLKGGVESTNKVFGFMKSMLPALGFAAVTGAISGVISKIIGVRQEFEKYEAILTNTYQDHDTAVEKMGMLQDLAVDLPVSLREVTEGFIKLKNRGMEPTKEDIMTLTDIAMSQGKSLDQFIEAILDAQTGEFERLKEFGITSKQQGDKVSMTFKGQTTVVQKNDEAIKNYIMSLGKLPGVAGSASAVMNTLQGKISNLGDSFDRMWNAMGEGRLGTAIKGAIGWIGSLIDKTTAFVKVPTSEKIREEQADLNTLVRSIVSVNNNQKIRNGLIAELQQKYPSFLGNVSAEKVTNEQLLETLDQVNESYLKRIRIAVNQEDITKNETEMQNVWKEQRELVKKINQDYESLVKSKNKNATLDEKLAAISQSTTDVMVGQMVQSQKQDVLAQMYKDKLISLQDQENKLTKEYNELLKERSQINPNGDGGGPKVGDKKNVNGIAVVFDGKSWIALENKNLKTGNGIQRDNIPLSAIPSITTAQVSEDDILFASKKHSQEEWTKFLQKQVDKQLKIQKAALEEEKAIEEARNGLIDAQMSGIEQLSGQLSGMFKEGSAAQIAFFAVEKAAAIAQIWINYARELSFISLTVSEMNALIPGSGLVYGAIAKKKALANAIVGTTLVGVQAIAGKQSGGYANFDGPDNEPDGIYHKGEFIGSAPSVRNSTVKPVYDIIKYAQDSGTIATLNLPAVMASMGMIQGGSRQSGGYANPTTSTTQFFNPPVPQYLDSNTATLLIEALNRFADKKLIVFTEMIKKDLDTLENIKNNSGL